MATQVYEVPVHNEEFMTTNIQLDLINKQAVVHVGTRPEGSTGEFKLQMKVIDVTPLFSAELTADEITAFKKGLKLLVAEAWGKTLSDITGDVI